MSLCKFIASNNVNSAIRTYISNWLLGQNFDVKW